MSISLAWELSTTAVYSTLLWVNLFYDSFHWQSVQSTSWQMWSKTWTEKAVHRTAFLLFLAWFILHGVLTLSVGPVTEPRLGMWYWVYTVLLLLLLLSCVPHFSVIVEHFELPKALYKFPLLLLSLLLLAVPGRMWGVLCSALEYG